MIDAYLDRGWHIFPIKRRSKHPLTLHGLHDASNSPDQVARWQREHDGCGWGINAGASGLLVVDLDGLQGTNAWQALTHKHTTPRTLVAQTGGGGYHLVYTDPTGRGRNTASLLAARVDTRGHGGYIVAPPSIHPNGKPYKWQTSIEPVPCPAWILEQIDPPRPAPTPPSMTPDYGATRFGEKTLAGILDRLAKATDGERHSLNHWAGVRVGQLHATGHVTTAALSDVIAVASGIRKHAPQAERDAREGWAWGCANPDGRYQPPRDTHTIPALRRPPTIMAPR